MDLDLISITFTSGASNGFFSIVWIFCLVPLFPTGYDLAKVYKNFPKALPERENCLTSILVGVMESRKRTSFTPSKHSRRNLKHSNIHVRFIRADQQRKLNSSYVDTLLRFPLLDFYLPTSQRQAPASESRPAVPQTYILYAIKTIEDEIMPLTGVCR
ncbi:MAG: hypothetical protein MJZ17_07280 [Bacteroidales bacterium]|nr:hypothetical protein [Bacteroidales bacterium]